MIYFTSDLHFGHDKPFLFEPRGFSSIIEHDMGIIDNWNKRICENDTVYILGDLMMGVNHSANIDKINSLNGHKILLRGNHDSDLKMKLYKENGIIFPSDGVWGSLLSLKKWNFFLSHLPTLCGNLDDRHHGLYGLHGHTHSQDRFEFMQFRSYNVALDAHNNFPVSIDEIISDIETYKKREG